MKIFFASLIACALAVRKPQVIVAEIESKLAELKQVLAQDASTPTKTRELFDKILFARVTVLDEGAVRVIPVSTVDSVPMDPFVVTSLELDSDYIVRV